MTAKLLEREPTSEMIEAGCRAVCEAEGWDGSGNLEGGGPDWALRDAEAIGAYRAMWDAAPAPPAAEPVAKLYLSVERKIGMHGAAFDSLRDARAYTYQNQPHNGPAWRFGRAASKTMKEPAGDYIDVGLGLLKFLEEEGYGIYALLPDEPVGDWGMRAVAIAEAALLQLGHAPSASREPGADPRRDQLCCLIEPLLAPPDAASIAAEAYERGRKAGREEGARCADQWSSPAAVRLAAGELTAQELRTAQAVARGIAAAIRALASKEAGNAT